MIFCHHYSFTNVLSKPQPLAKDPILASGHRLKLRHTHPVEVCLEEHAVTNEEHGKRHSTAHTL